MVRRVTHVLQQTLDRLTHAIGHLLQHVLHLVEPAADSLRLRPHRLHRLDQARRPIRRHRQRHRQVATHHAAQVLQPRVARLLVPQAQVQQHLRSVRANGPGHQDRLPAARLLTQALVHRVAEQVDHVEARQITLGEGLELFPQYFRHAADGALTQKRLLVVGIVRQLLQKIFDVARR